MTLENESDREFIAGLYEKYNRLIYSEVRKIVSDNWGIQDIMQCALIRLVNKVSLLRSLDERKLVNYVITTARNQAKNYLRQTAKKTAVRSIDSDEYNIENIQDDGFDVEKIIIRKEQLTQLSNIWPQLDEPCRTLLESKYILNQSDAEIAEALGVKPASVRMLLTRARRKALGKIAEVDVEV